MKATEEKSTTTSRRARGDLWAMVLLVLASFIFTADQVGEHQMMSPIDEYQYVGYYASVADQGVVRQGTEMPLFAKRYMVCHGVRAIPEMGRNPAGCRAPESVNYPIAGGTTADLYTPLYFLSIRAIAQPLVWAKVGFVDAGRLAGGAWLAFGAVLLYLAMRRMRTPAPAALGLGLVLVGSLPAYWGNTYISTDATALAAGAAAAWLTVRALQGVRGSLVLLPVASAVFTLFKLQNLIGFVVSAVILVLAALVDAGRQRDQGSGRVGIFLHDRRLVSAIAIGLAAIAAQGIWLWIRAALAVGPQPELGLVVPLEGKHLVLELGNFLPLMAQGAMAPYATGPASLPVYAIGTMLAVGGSVGLAMSTGVPARRRIVGLATVVTTIIAAPALAVAIGVMEGVYIPIPNRYGASLFPWAILSAAILLDTRHRWARYAVLALGAVTWSLALMMGEG
ncbi:hypothetical protein ASG76_10565 [Nocardioides sp. Soil774]|uniref:hypothetical protein n=1 Tax=Nocardioides sp. Soil774 TaxID=1736408 RepID=UPI0006F937F0|nr:hypothetical protein [Nocardioides sp. Soil774]KRE94821.1 hypothetical protein ASG76_10565 [Nocardioides sp. Soil774]